ncbi:hypothetical protein B7494_g8610, partial [Chlorociboria aeruginascens]
DHTSELHWAPPSSIARTQNLHTSEVCLVGVIIEHAISGSKVPSANSTYFLANYPMHSLTYHRDHPNLSLGERRGKPDPAKFSLDLSWARAVCGIAPSRAYPSPPMSGSPPIPPRRIPDSSDRGHGSYGSVGQEDVLGRSQRTHPEPLEQMRAPVLQPYQQGMQPPMPYSVYQMESITPSQRQYPQLQQRPQIQPEQHQTYSPQPSGSVAMPSMAEVPGYPSPKAQRKTKGHVASACVPCKRAHLRCDAQRPCSRCLSNGKDDACVDVQHKKRGRPRLRDEREPRYEGMGPNYPPPDAMRRPVSMYAAGDVTVSMPFNDLQRSSSYRVLKSQGGAPMGGPLSGRYIDRPLADPSVYGGSMPPTPRMLPTIEPACAYLTMDMQFVKATHAFGETVGVQPLTGRRLQDVLSMSDRDKVFRLQKMFEDERREREPNYLPPIYLKYEEDRVIQSVGFGPEEVNQFRTDHTEYFTFQGPDGQQRAFQVRLGLAKRESTYFIVGSVQGPATPQMYHHPSSSSPYSRESFSRDSQYGLQTPQSYSQPSVSPFMSSPAATFGDPRESVIYRGPGSLVPSIPSAMMNVPFTQAPRSEFVQGQAPYQTPRSEVPQQAQHDLQLPPIRDQGPAAESRQRDDRSGRVAIGGLLAKPDLSRRGQ